MTEVKRYESGAYYCSGDAMVREEDGPYVLYEDYTAIKAERDALAANVSDGLGQLAGAMLNCSLDSGSKQAVAYAECADMVATFAANLRKG